jgi:flagellar hook-associated protein 1 FlgK
LLDGRPVTLGFAATGFMTADMSLASGALSGLTINDQAVRSDGKGAISGGSLAAHFAVRDELAPAAQQNLDAVARDLIARFAEPGLAPGGTGLFTDTGQAFLPANETGLAQRISLNAAVSPENAGALWKLRDGFEAANPGPPGNASILNAMRDALTTPHIAASGNFGAANRSFSGLVAQFSSGVATARLGAETEASFATARLTVLSDLERQQGVDTDREVQDLLLIEQAYAANARVVQTVDDMIKILLGM